MKKFIFTILLVMPFVLSAQNYTNICSPGATFFKKLNLTSIKGYKATSFQAMGGGDTTYYSFKAIRDTAAECFDTTKGSIFGRKIYRREVDGMFLFFNKKSDTIYINTKALLNTTWRFIRLSSGTYLEAKVISVGNDSVLGGIDEVKKVELQAKRNDGTPQPNPWNGKYFMMSKKYGLSRTFDMVNVPWDTTFYTLVGKTSGAMGIQDFGWKDVYKYNVGDVFHLSGYSTSYIGNPNTTWKEIQTVFFKQTYGTNIDSVLYKIDRCRSTVSTPGGHTYIHDTLQVKYKFNVLASDSSILRMPDQFARKNQYANQYDRFMKAMNSRQTKKIGEDKYRFMNGCWIIPQGSVTVNRGYTEGVGQSEYFRGDSESQQYSKVVYFKKGSETWGAPVGTECSPLLDVPEQKANAGSVRIIPNPMKNRAVIVIDGITPEENAQFILFNLVGQEVYKTSVTNSSTTIERNELPSGMYIWVLKGTSTNSNGKLMIN